jgi:hypothetical protein
MHMAIIYVVANDPDPNSDWRDPCASEILSQQIVAIENIPNPGGYLHFKTISERPDILCGVPRTQSVDDMVSTIIRRVTQQKVKINLIRICCHGDNGKLLLGSYSTGGIQIEQLEPFGRLKDHFDGRAGVRREIKIHACGVASDYSIGLNLAQLRCVISGKCDRKSLTLLPGTFRSPAEIATMWHRPFGFFSPEYHKVGLEFMRGLARLTGAAVQAAINIQYADHFYFIGPTVYVYPPSQHPNTAPTLVDHAEYVVLDYDTAGVMGYRDSSGQWHSYGFVVPPDKPGKFEKLIRRDVEIQEGNRRLRPKTQKELNEESLLRRRLLE